MASGIIDPLPSLDSLAALEKDLEAHVDPKLATKWDRKVEEYILPTEVKRRKKKVSLSNHIQKLTRLSDFEVRNFRIVSESWLTSTDVEPQEKRFEEVHYFGIANALPVKSIMMISNWLNREVTAYDISTVGYNNGRMVIRELEQNGETPNSTTNMVRRADITYALRPKFINPKTAKLLVLARVLEVLENEEAGKFEETCIRLGPFLEFADVLMIYPDIVNNENTIWGDAKPFRLKLAAEFMARGLGAKVYDGVLGEAPHYNHQYTAARLSRHRL